VSCARHLRYLGVSCRFACVQQHEFEREWRNDSPIIVLSARDVFHVNLAPFARSIPSTLSRRTKCQQLLSCIAAFRTHKAASRSDRLPRNRTPCQFLRPVRPTVRTPSEETSSGKKPPLPFSAHLSTLFRKEFDGLSLEALGKRVPFPGTWLARRRGFLFVREPQSLTHLQQRALFSSAALICWRGKPKSWREPWI